MKINPFSLPRPIQSGETRTFTDPSQPGVELVISLRPLDVAETNLAVELGERMAEMYIGDPENDVAPSHQFPYVGGKPVAMSRKLCIGVALILAMQTAEGDEAYTFEQMVAIAVTMPRAWRGISEWSAKLQSKAHQGKGSGELAATS